MKNRIFELTTIENGVTKVVSTETKRYSIFVFIFQLWWLRHLRSRLK